MATDLKSKITLTFNILNLLWNFDCRHAGHLILFLPVIMYISVFTISHVVSRAREAPIAIDLDYFQNISLSYARWNFFDY